MNDPQQQSPAPMADDPAEVLAVMKDIGLFKAVPEGSLARMARHCKRYPFRDGEDLFTEGEARARMYVILSGEVSVLRRVAGGQQEVSTMGPGAWVGELALLGQEEASATVRARGEVLALGISVQDFEQEATIDAAWSRVYPRLARLLRERMLEVAAVAAESLQAQLNEAKDRLAGTTVFFNAVIGLCLFAVMLQGLTSLTKIVPSNTVINLIVVVAFSIAFANVILTAKLSRREIGLTLEGWRPALRDGLLWTLPLLGLILLLKVALVAWVPAFAGQPIFDPMAAVNHRPGAYGAWLLTVLVYAVLAPVQELLARGTLQGSIARILVGPRRDLRAILVSNMLFSTLHLYLSVTAAVMTFITGLMWGFLFARHRTLVAPAVSHLMVGFWALSILGLQALLRR